MIGFGDRPNVVVEVVGGKERVCVRERERQRDTEK